MGQSAGALAANSLGEVLCTCREPHEFLPAEDCASQDGYGTQDMVTADRIDVADVKSENTSHRALMGNREGSGSFSEKDNMAQDPSRAFSRTFTTMSQRTDMMLGESVARKKFRGAIEKVKAVNRIAKSVRFSDETVVCFEVKSEGSSAYKGLTLGDKVIWNDSDDDVPKGTVGEVTGFSAGGIVQVRFPKGTWDFRAAELSTQDSWSAGVARTAIGKAEKLMRDLQVLEAEAILSEALAKLNEAVSLERFDDVRELTQDAQIIIPGTGTSSDDPNFSQRSTSSGSNNADQDNNNNNANGGNGGTASPKMPQFQRGNSQSRLARSNSRDMSGTRSPGLRRASLLSQSEAAEARAAIARMQENMLYKDVLQRAGQYQGLTRALLGDGRATLCYDGPGAQLWVYTPPGVSWFEYRLVCDLGTASLAQCCAHCFEADLERPNCTNKTSSPKAKGVHPSLFTAPTSVSLLCMRIDMVLERFRWYNNEYGFYAESSRSVYPIRGKDGELKQSTNPSWKGKVVVHSQHIWMPRGGGAPGTMSLQLVRIDAGSRAARWTMSSFGKRAAKGLIEEIQSAVARGAEPAYAERIANDKLGFYSQLAKVEAAAAKRATVSLNSLPGEEAVKRLYPLATQWP